MWEQHMHVWESSCALAHLHPPPSPCRARPPGCWRRRWWRWLWCPWRPPAPLPGVHWGGVRPCTAGCRPPHCLHQEQICRPTGEEPRSRAAGRGAPRTCHSPAGSGPSSPCPPRPAASRPGRTCCCGRDRYASPHRRGSQSCICKGLQSCFS